MSRLRRFAHSLASGYVLLGTNVLFTLGSIPLALHYLSPAEFGLWALTIQIAGYLALIDLGMSAAASRILVDYKDDRKSGAYGGAIQTMFLVNVVQGICVILIAFGLVWTLAPLLKVPASMRNTFQWLLLWQAVLVAISFFIRITGLMLGAHQRYDIANYAQAGLFVANFVALWAFLDHGSGIFGMIWAQLAGMAVGGVLSFLGAAKLGLIPSRTEWSRPSWEQFRVFFAFGRDMFLFAVGSQLILASQTILITRVLGLETAALWSVCTRTFNLVGQLVYRFFDYACAPLAEMIVREERSRLFDRFRSLVSGTGTATVWAVTLFVFGNQAFIAWWTQGAFGWPASNDLLLGLWLFVCVLVRNHAGLAGLRKEFRFLRYLYFLEGVFFVVTGTVALYFWGIPGMLLASLAASLLFSFPYGVRRTSEFFGISWQTVVFDWMKPAYCLAALLVPPTAVVWWFTREMEPTMRLLTGMIIPGALGVFLLLRWGLEPSLKKQLRDALPARLSLLRAWIN